MKKNFKIPLWSFDRAGHQPDYILRNRYIIELTAKPSFAILHQVFSEDKWRMGYSWFDLYFTNIRGEDKPDKKYLFGLLKRYDDYWDGPIITWIFGCMSLNYRW